jgi:hypothetical protein
MAYGLGIGIPGSIPMHRMERETIRRVQEQFGMNLDNVFKARSLDDLADRELEPTEAEMDFSGNRASYL